MKIMPYGSWRSPITSDSIVAGTVGLGQIALDGDDVYWVETRPSEKGRYSVVRLTSGVGMVDITPANFNVRTRVHEYGGGSFVVSDGTIIFANFIDQRLYRQTAGSQPQAITPPILEAGLRYADLVIDGRRNRLICVREDHTSAGREAVNTIVAIDLNGAFDQQVLASGNDFYSSPRVSPDGSRLAWLAWDHPNMPWDGCELWVAELVDDGSLADKALAEFGLPQWIFGISTYAFATANRIVATYIKQGISHLAILDTSTGRIETIESPYTRIEGIRCRSGERGSALFIAGSPHESSSIVKFDLSTKRFERVRRSSELTIEPGYISIPQAIEFPTEGGLAAHAFFYAPANRDFAAPDGELPPLLVMSHGGPTAATNPILRLGIQYWTSRGLAVLDVNYGGSTGYGRAYRERLRGNWGVTDVDDCVNGAQYLAGLGKVDKDRLAITGGSAGGYTTLCALTFRDIFSAGASHYGVSDLEALEVDTHKFESRYSHSLIAPYPERADLYRQRSPIHFTDRLKVPVIFFQGLEDKIVPPNQTEMMVEALRAKRLPVAYIAFEGEQHGFRQAANIKRSLDGEFYFYSRVFGFEPADEIEPVEILNL
jgi:dipeptidyl aminopeptidase/acylaminoacyl peptidase